MTAIFCQSKNPAKKIGFHESLNDLRPKIIFGAQLATNLHFTFY